MKTIKPKIKTSTFKNSVSVSNVVSSIVTSAITMIAIHTIQQSMHLKPHDIYEKTIPSIVTISTRSLEQDPFSARKMIETPLGIGTGFVLEDPNSKYIITNAHVINKAFTVLVNDIEAEIVGIDLEHDVAVLELDPGLELSRSIDRSLIKCNKPAFIGQPILSIGNPYGFEKTMTSGIISGTKRGLDGENMLVDMLQFDASLNPGGSGGVLLSADDGCLLGMNTAIVSASGSSAGLGFAIPIDKVYQSINNIINDEEKEGFKLGVTLVPDQYSEVLGLDGVIIADVIPGSIADSLGIVGTHRDEFGRPYVGDIIIRINEKIIKKRLDVYKILETCKHGDVLNLMVSKIDDVKKYEIFVE